MEQKWLVFVQPQAQWDSVSWLGYEVPPNAQ